MDGITPKVNVEIKGDTKDAFNTVDRIINKISSAIGILYRPIDIVLTAMAKGQEKKTLARADVDVAALFAKSNVPLDDVGTRAVVRVIAQETRKQENMEAVFSRAIPMLGPGADPESVDEDFIHELFDKASRVTDPQMQLLWAKILAGEINQASSFSKQTLNVMGMLSKRDAEDFLKVCKFACEVSGSVYLLIYHLGNPIIYAEHGVTFPVINRLQDRGLLHFQAIGGRQITMSADGIALVVHGDKAVILDVKEGYNFALGNVYFTESGFELYSICSPDKDFAYLDEVARLHGNTTRTHPGIYNYPGDPVFHNVQVE